MLWILPIEPLEERYTKQWYDWFPQECERQGIKYEVIDGVPLTDRVEVGTFLDVNSTMHYKATQIAVLAGNIRCGLVHKSDTIFLADGEMFGMEGSIRYLLQMNGLADVKVVAFIHAGSYTQGDFVQQCSYFAEKYEQAWANVFDMILVGSEYHAHRLYNHRGIPLEMIQVTGNPYDVDAVKSSITYRPKVKRVIHTNRPDPEKQPDVTLDIFEVLKQKHPDWEFMVTTSRRVWGAPDLRKRALRLQEQGIIQVRENLTKVEYLSLLQESVVMTGNTIEENFGYCLLEAMLMDAIPVVPEDYSHPELVGGDRRCMFASRGEQIIGIEMAMDHPFPVSQYAEQYRHSLQNIVKLLK